MQDAKWLESYAGQSTKELASLAGEYRSDSVAAAFAVAIQAKADRLGDSALTPEERVVLAVEALEREVNNGGFLQFFDNASRAFAPSIVDALERIGCSKAAELAREAIDALGLSEPVTVDAIERATEEENEPLEDALSACDERYYETVGDLSGPLLDFIRLNEPRIDLGAR